jgi:hypothetical protein
MTFVIAKPTTNVPILAKYALISLKKGATTLLGTKGATLAIL